MADNSNPIVVEFSTKVGRRYAELIDNLRAEISSDRTRWNNEIKSLVVNATDEIIIDGRTKVLPMSGADLYNIMSTLGAILSLINADSDGLDSAKKVRARPLRISNNG